MSASHSRADNARLRSESFPGFSLRDLVTALFYYKRATLLAFVIPVMLGILAGLLAHTSYVAQARLLVLYGSDYVCLMSVRPRSDLFAISQHNGDF